MLMAIDRNLENKSGRIIAFSEIANTTNILWIRKKKKELINMEEKKIENNVNI